MPKPFMYVGSSKDKKGRNSPSNHAGKKGLDRKKLYFDFEITFSISILFKHVVIVLSLKQNAMVLQVW